MTRKLSVASPEAPFDDRLALIFGGARGIGAAVAQEFVRRGARVILADIDYAAAQDTAAAMEAAGGATLALACDVRCSDSMQAAVAEAEQWGGDIDIVVNNVGVMMSGYPEDVPLAEWQRVMDLNLFPVVRSNEIFLPKMIARGSGHIVNTASFAGLYPYAINRMPYVASKSAVVALTESLALYLMPQGICVSCFCPGPVMTNILAGSKSWSKEAVMRGPGEQFMPISAQQAAAMLADGMRDGRILIPTDPQVWRVMQEHAEAPDQFIRGKSESFARGETGLPSREAIQALMAAAEQPE